jgi:hypothetical protein
VSTEEIILLKLSPISHYKEKTIMTESQVSTVEFELSAMELSEAELDTVAGGTSLNMGGLDSLFSGSSSDFMQRNVSMGQMSFAGPGGAFNASTLDISEIASSASQFTAMD